jgi:hypothetical protein
MTIPAGLSYVLWLVPPQFVTYNFTAVLFSGEVTILCLFAAFAFFLIGQQRFLTTNLSACVGFAIGAFAPILSYPSAAAYLIPILALYCFGFLMTCENRKEFCWKVTVSAIVLTVMLIARVPEFILNLYSYGFAAYFFEFSLEVSASLAKSLADSSLLGFFIYYFNLRGVISIVFALGALVTAAYAAKGHLRRFAVAALVCEGGIIAVTTITGGRAALLPVNLLQIGLLFEKEVDARISYRFGLFQDARCRGDDLRRADNLKLKEALVRNNRATLNYKQATF